MIIESFFLRPGDTFENVLFSCLMSHNMDLKIVGCFNVKCSWFTVYTDIWQVAMLHIWNHYATANTKQTEPAAWEGLKREVRRDISSISGEWAEKRQNMKLKGCIEKTNKQKNCYEQVMTDGHTLSPRLCKHLTVVLLSQVLFAVILLETITVRVQYVGLDTDLFLECYGRGNRFFLWRAKSLENKAC